jgi:AraC family transcriptional regulator of arabinose operon
MNASSKGGSLKNIWYGIGRQRIEIPKSVLNSLVTKNEFMNNMYLHGLGYYPKAEGHYTYRKKGLKENFLFYCVDGAGFYKIKDKTYKVNANEFFFLPQNVEHAYGSNLDDPWTIYWIHFGGDGLTAFNSMHIIEKHFEPTYIKSNDQIFALFDKMYKTLELGYSYENLLFVNMCLSQFISYFIHNSKHFASKSIETNDCVDKAILYMQENIQKNISLQQLSSVYNYSPSRFSALFKQKTGYAPIDYFIQMKMQRASQKLDLSNDSVKAIAIEMGFDDPYYFTRRFTKIIGVSPTKYRSMQKD